MAMVATVSVLTGASARMLNVRRTRVGSCGIELDGRHLADIDAPVGDARRQVQRRDRFLGVGVVVAKLAAARARSRATARARSAPRPAAARTHRPPRSLRGPACRALQNRAARRRNRRGFPAPAMPPARPPAPPPAVPPRPRNATRSLTRAMESRSCVTITTVSPSNSRRSASSSSRPAAVTGSSPAEGSSRNSSSGSSASARARAARLIMPPLSSPGNLPRRIGRQAGQTQPQHGQLAPARPPTAPVYSASGRQTLSSTLRPVNSAPC